MNGRSFTRSPAQGPEAPAADGAHLRLESLTTRLPGDGWSVDDVLARFDPAAECAMAWAEGAGELAFVAEGVAWTAPGAGEGLSGWRRAERAWRGLLAGARREGEAMAPATGPVLVGAAAFDPDGEGTGGIWAPFGRGWLVLPRRMLTLHRGRAYLTENRMVPDGAGETGAPAPVGSRPDGDGTDGEGGRARWYALVEAARVAIGRGEVRKLVVARRETVRSRRPPVEVLRRLARREPRAFTFALAAPGAVFCGATPELLARREGRRVTSLCLAGTAARTGAAAEDARLEAGLRASAKDREEHRLVCEGVARALERTCREVTLAPEPSVRPLADVQHLATEVAAELRPGFGLVDVVADLHPTAAVAGSPSAASLAWLRAHEGLARGLYGGPVGWLGADGDGVFAVALRSGVLEPERGVAHLFAGCGIVEGSDAGREWEESALKMRVMRAALEGGG